MKKLYRIIAKKITSVIASISAITAVTVTVTAIALSVIDCGDPPVRTAPAPAAVTFSSFRNVPDVTDDEIAAIEALQARNTPLTCASFKSTELFVRPNGTLGGFSVLFYEWLSNLFGITFDIRLYGVSEIYDKLDSGLVDFSGNIMPTKEREAKYYMTDVIAERKFITVRLKDATSLNRIAKPRYAYGKASAVGDAIAALLPPDSYEGVLANDYFEAYEILKNDLADAYIATNISEAYFIDYDDVVIEDFFPLIFNPAVMGASKTRPELEAVISIVNKALRSGANLHLLDMYKQGYREYQKNAVAKKLTDSEQAFIAANKSVPVLAYTINYPLSFYNDREEQWQGIYFDLLNEISALTGLEFVVAHSKDEPYLNLRKRHYDGDIAIAPEMTRTDEAKQYFIWSDILVAEDHYALLSRLEYPDITLNEIPHVKVGMAKNTSHSGYFKQWFPDHKHTTEYPDIETAFIALKKGEVDMVMSTHRRLMYLTHYREEIGFKANIVFKQRIETRLVAHKNYEELMSIIDKALKTVDIESIVNRWSNKTYDYRAKMAEAKRPWLIGTAVLVITIFAFVIISFYRNRRESIERAVIRESEERMRVLLDATPLSVILIDKNFQCIYVNEEAVRLNGLKSKKEYMDMYSQGRLILERGGEFLRIAFKEGYWHGELKAQRPDGSMVPCDITLIRLKYKDDDVIAGYARDLSEEKATIEKILKTEEQKRNVEEAHHQLQMILDTMPIGIRIISLDDFTLLYSNKECLKVFGCTSFEDQVKNRSGLGFMPVFQPDGRTTAMHLEEMFKYDNITAEFQCIKLNGEPFTCRMTSCTINYAGHRASLAAMEDVTAELRKQEMLRKAVLQEREANLLKSRFLATMSHEIRTPMNAIIGMSELALRKDKLADVHDDVKMIKNAGSNLLAIINDILDFSRIESGKMKIVNEDYSIASLINDVVSIVKVKLAESQIMFDVYVDDKIPGTLAGDVVRIRQSLLNLLNNAVKFTEAGLISFSVEGDITDDENVVLTMTVADTGCGIKEDDIGKLFGDFVQLDSVQNKGIEGTGLGLAITKRLVEAMGGNIAVESVYGQGSTFTITLPQKIRTLTPLAMAKFNERDGDTSDTVTFRAPTARILAVDDVIVNLNVIEGLLAPYNMRIDTCLSGSEAIEAVKANAYDVILMDHMMPGMDGVETVKHIRALANEDSRYAHLKDVPIIALTANAVSGMKEMFLENGFNDFQSKPIDTVKIDAALKRWIPKEKQVAVAGDGE